MGDNMKRDKRFTYLNHTSVEGLELIFYVLCLICKIMIYRLPVHDSIDRARVDGFEKELEELTKK